jgi:hypothetical protein
MKTLLSLASVAALSAFSLSFVSFEVATSLLIGAGLLAIAFNDYARRVRPLVTEMTPADAAALGRERFRLAA